MDYKILAILALFAGALFLSGCAGNSNGQPGAQSSGNPPSAGSGAQPFVGTGSAPSIATSSDLAAAGLSSSDVQVFDISSAQSDNVDVLQGDVLGGASSAGMPDPLGP